MASRRKTEDLSNAAKFIPSYNSDMIIEILLCLPAKFVVQCKLVSKTWCHLISSHHFSCLWHQRRSRPSGLFFPVYSLIYGEYQYVPLTGCGGKDKLPNETIPLHVHDFTEFFSARHQTVDSTVLQSSNGLLLIKSNGKYDCHEDNPHRPAVRRSICGRMSPDKPTSRRLVSCRMSTGGDTTTRYQVYNPTTKNYATLPRLRRELVCSVNLSFDFSISPHYKVIALCCVRDLSLTSYLSRFYQILISEDGGLWRLSGNIFELALTMQVFQGVSWNNSIIWLNFDMVNEMSSLCFNVSQEKLRPAASPPIRHRAHDDSFYFGEAQGHLNLIEIDDRSGIQFFVYEMEKDCSSWLFKYHIDLTDELHYKKPSSVFVLLSIIHGSVEEDSSLIFYVSGQVISYGIKRKSLTKICEFATDFIGSRGLESAEYCGLLQGYQHTDSIWTLR